MICPECYKNQCAPNRKICYTCKGRKWIEKNRIAKCWHNIKRSAKKRNIKFEITLDEFKILVLKTGYMKNKGRLSNDLTIDRTIPGEGYTVNNLIVMPKRLNVSKYHEEEKYPF